MTLSFTRNHAGAWIISAIVKNYLRTRTYYGYTKREAARLFREDIKAEISKEL